MGERTLRRLLIIGSSAVVQQASKRGAPRGSWLEQMLARKPRMLVTVALANKMARIVWALLVKQENYRAPVAAKARSWRARGRQRCSRSKEGMAQQSARRGRKNQMYSSCLEHAFMIWFRSANSHTGPQLHRCIRGRTDGSIRLRANLLQKPLASGGASTDEYTPWSSGTQVRHIS